MDNNKFKNNLINTIKYDFSINNKQKVMNMIIKEKIATYHPKKDINSINVVNMSLDDKIELCLNSNNKVIDLINQLEFEKGYRYSILLKYKNIDLNLIENKYTNVDSNYYYEYNENISDDEILFKKTDEKYFIKFHKYINIIDKKNLERKEIRYPILIIIYKDINILEVCFDKISYNGDFDFYKLTMEARIARLVKDISLKSEPFSLENTIKAIDKDYEHIAKIVIWSFEAARSKGLTLKVGEDGVMPFIGEIEILIKSLKDKYNNKIVNKALEEITQYLYRTKEFANEKFRIISWEKKYNPNKDKFEILGENTLDMKINFEYKDTRYDLINIYENEINNMERCNYVIRSICEIAKRTGNL